jgi:hypothetical protein
LGQIVGGSWRQILLAKKLGVHAALGLELNEWVRDRLGGYVRLEKSERLEVVKELAADGASTREIAEVIGVAHKTVARDLSVSNDTKAPAKLADFVSNDTSSDRDDALIYDGPDGKVYDFTDTASAERGKREAERNARQGLYVGLREIERWMYIFNEGAQRQYIIDSCREHPDELDAQKLVSNIAQWANNLIQTLESLNEQIRGVGQAAATGTAG